MKMMVLSDNHGRWQQVYKILKEIRPTVDYVFHLGDSEFEYDDAIWDLVDGVVRGNMDDSIKYPLDKTIETPEGKVLLVHGHLQGVNRSNEAIYRMAKERGAKFAFHGHTHQLNSEYKDGILLVNPGSLNSSRGMHPYRTYAIVTVEPKLLHVEFYDEDMNLLDELTQTYPR